MLTLDDVTVSKGTFQLRANLQVPPGLTAVIGPSGGGSLRYWQLSRGSSLPWLVALFGTATICQAKSPGSGP